MLYDKAVKKLSKPEKNYGEISELLLKSSLQGNSNSKYLLGTLHLSGKFGFEKNEKKAFEFIFSSASLGNVKVPITFQFCSTSVLIK